MEFVIGFILLACFVGIAGFFSDTHKAMREKEQHEFDLKKKADEQALEAQRKKNELDLEMRRKAAEAPYYQEQAAEVNRLKNTNTKLKLVLACGVLLTISLIFWFYGNSETQIPTYATNANLVPEAETNELVVEQRIQNENLPERYLASNEQDLKVNRQLEVLPLVSESQSNVGTQEKEQLEQLSQVVTVDQVHNFIGKNIKFCGEVSQVSTTQKATYMNFGGRYPKHKFSAVIWSNSIMPALEGSNICITGLIESYKGIPQIVISSFENQVSIN